MGGSGGGSSSGAVSYPAYMQTWHGQALDDDGVDTFTTSMTELIEAAVGNSPWTGAAAYNPDADITALLASVGDLQTLVTLLSAGTTLDTLISDILDPTFVDDVVTEYSADLNARFLAETLPTFEAGMRDINAVTSSAFTIGRAILQTNVDRQVAKFSSELHLKAASDDAIKIINLKLEYQRLVTSLVVEARRIKIVAKKEQTDMDYVIDEKDALWDMEAFQYGGNLLAAIAGAAASTGKISSTQSTIGGALSGASAGAQLSGGNPWGAAIGAVLGGIGGYFSG